MYSKVPITLILKRFYCGSILLLNITKTEILEKIPQEMYKILEKF